MNLNVDMWSGNDLRNFREKFSITKTSMARALSCSTVRIWQIEKGDLILSDSMKNRIRKAFFTSCTLIEKV